MITFTDLTESTWLQIVANHDAPDDVGSSNQVLETSTQ